MNEKIIEAEQLIIQERQSDAVVLLMEILEKNSAEHKARLLLARTLYNLKLRSFAAQQLSILTSEFPDNSRLSRLYNLITGKSDEVGVKAYEDSREVDNKVSTERVKKGTSEVIVEEEIEFDADYFT